MGGVCSKDLPEDIEEEYSIRKSQSHGFELRSNKSSRKSQNMLNGFEEISQISDLDPDTRIEKYTSTMVGSVGKNSDLPPESMKTKVMNKYTERVGQVLQRFKDSLLKIELSFDQKSSKKGGPYFYEVELSTYIGSYKSGRRCGYGQIVYGDSTLYEGSWMKDSKNGKGLFVFPNGDYYFGSFLNDKPHGTGKISK